MAILQANPFGDAKPIDAEAKIREIEEREKKRRVSHLYLTSNSLLFVPSDMVSAQDGSLSVWWPD